jgi:hypothetical protein
MKFSKILALAALVVGPVAFGCTASTEDPAGDEEANAAAAAEPMSGVSEEAIAPPHGEFGCPFRPFECDRHCKHIYGFRRGHGVCLGFRHLDCVCRR